MENYIGNALAQMAQIDQSRQQNALAQRQQDLRENQFAIEQQDAKRQQSAAWEEKAARRALSASRIVQMAAQKGQDPKAVVQSIAPEFVGEFEKSAGPGSWANVKPEQVLSMAQLIEQKSMAALGEMPPGFENNQQVHSTFIGDNGNVWIVPKVGTKPVDTGVPSTKFAQRSITTDAGVMNYDPRTGRITSTLVDQPTLAKGKADTAATVASATERAKAAVEAQVNLPDALNEVQKMRDNVTGLLNSKGFNSIYGARVGTGTGQAITRFASQDAANSMARREQLSAQAFSVVIKNMRGLGALSNAEGQKITAAYTRATDPTISPDEAKKAWAEVLNGLDKAEATAKQKAGGQSTQQSAPSNGVKFLGFE